jgi:hypothetical protein
MFPATVRFTEDARRRVMSAEQEFVKDVPHKSQYNLCGTIRLVLYFRTEDLITN